MQLKYNQHLRICVNKLRMYPVLDIIIDEIDIDSRIRFLLSLYKQKLKDPNESLMTIGSSAASENVKLKDKRKFRLRKERLNQLAPHLANEIGRTIVALRYFH